MRNRTNSSKDLITVAVTLGILLMSVGIADEGVPSNPSQH
jgi:hypothetical protein